MLTYLMQSLVKRWRMQPTVNPINATVRKEQEQWNCKYKVGQPILVWIGIQERVTLDFSVEPWNGQDNKSGYGGNCGLDFELNLVLEELGVIHLIMIKDEIVRSRSEYEIKEVGTDIDDDEKG